MEVASAARWGEQFSRGKHQSVDLRYRIFAAIIAINSESTFAYTPVSVVRLYDFSVLYVLFTATLIVFAIALVITPCRHVSHILPISAT